MPLAYIIRGQLMPDKTTFLTPSDFNQEALRDSGARLPIVHPHAKPVWHLFVVRVQDRDSVQATLQKQGIAAGVHYPVPLHRQPAYKCLRVPEESLPVTERVAAHVISLPMYPELSRDQIEVVSRAVLETASAERLEARRACAF
jgi:dTDP-4-amino-4,6-dideoxygalactose transaminase